MIKSKADYRSYCQEDEKALGVSKSSFLSRYYNPIWRFEHALRRHEYYQNCFKKAWQRPLVKLAALSHRRHGLRCGFSIPVNVFGKGLSIAHIGTIVVNSHARVGDYCRLHVCTNIGTEAGKSDAAPTIGSRVYIGPGAKIFGSIQLADDIAIGANAVVNKDFTTPGITIAGVPAKQISTKSSKGLMYAPASDEAVNDAQ